MTPLERAREAVRARRQLCTRVEAHAKVQPAIGGADWDLWRYARDELRIDLRRANEEAALALEELLAASE